MDQEASEIAAKGSPHAAARYIRRSTPTVRTRFGVGQHKSEYLALINWADQLGLRDPKIFKPLWVLDFPLLEQDEESGRWHAMHHPFTAPKPQDAHKLESDPGSVKANAYDLVINGTEIGGGSIRIHDRSMQEAMFRVLGFTDDDARYKFGFLMDAFEFGAPPHGGCAFGFDRWVSLFGHRTDIREFIAFPKNNAGRDTMIDAPGRIDKEQLEDLGITVNDPDV